ncbi:MAG TPA: 30S ribosomal protein S4e [Methanomassiliicoccales archaeon]|nr:30S ribosomal protein S4e [Methanomassiliicoccales archaeon]
MSSNDMKRLTAPRSWPVAKKTTAWIAKPHPGAHAKENSMPIAVVLRELLQVADTAREVKRILDDRGVLVDGRAVTDFNFAVGLMDVVSIPKIEQHYRMVIDRNGKLRLMKLPEGKQNWKLCRIENKTTVAGGKTQLNLHDGRNVLVSKDTYKVGDVLKFDVTPEDAKATKGKTKKAQEKRILETYKLAKGNTALITGGSNVGDLAVIEEYLVKRTTGPNLVKFKDGRSTVKGNVFVVGGKAPEVELPEASAL